MTSPEEYEFVVPDYCLRRVYARIHLVQAFDLFPNRSLPLHHRPANAAVELVQKIIFGVVLYVPISLSNRKNQLFTAAAATIIND